MKISVVLPLYNEVKHIAGVIQGISKYKIPIIVVNDGSTDLGKNFKFKSKITLLTHKINLGKGAAMMTGAEYAFSHSADAVIFMDSDGQHSPKNLIGFIEKLNMNKYDVVLGSRKLNREVPFVRRTGNMVASQIIKLFFGISVTDPLSGFRAITKSSFNKIRWDSSGYSVESEMVANIAKHNLTFVEIPVDTIYHDKYKGMSVLDAFGVLLDVLKWRLSP